MTWKPDEVIIHPDASRTEIYWRRRRGLRGERSRIRKEVAPDGTTQEVWHEVFDLNGTLIHQDREQ